MGPNEANVNQMQWRPKLIALTAIGNPGVDEGRATICYLHPDVIKLVVRGLSSWNRGLGDDGKPQEPPTHPQVECTVVWFDGGAVPVIEMPEEIARRRDEALGHERPKPKAVT